jgi:hypothetical protein
MSDQPTINIPPMCRTHQSLLVHQAGYGPNSEWRVLIIMAQAALFQGLSADAKVQAESKGDIQHLGTIGCHACRKPDLFGEVVEAAKSKDLGNIKALGERWVTAGAKH